VLLIGASTMIHDRTKSRAARRARPDRSAAREAYSGRSLGGHSRVSVRREMTYGPITTALALGLGGCVGGYLSSHCIQRPCGFAKAIGCPSRARTKERSSRSLNLSRAPISGSTPSPSNETQTAGSWETISMNLVNVVIRP
jgi:hypothetical protein